MKKYLFFLMFVLITMQAMDKEKLKVYYSDSDGNLFYSCEEGSSESDYDELSDEPLIEKLLKDSVAKKLENKNIIKYNVLQTKLEQTIQK